MQADDGWSVEAGWGAEAALPLVEDETPPEAASEALQLSGDMAAEREADIGTSTTKKLVLEFSVPKSRPFWFSAGWG
jgi:hypothetical protein